MPYEVLIDGLTLPGAGLTGNGVAMAGDIIEDHELDDHMKSLVDAKDPRTAAHLKYVKTATKKADDTTAVDERLEGLTAPWGDYDTMTAKDVVARLKTASRDEVDQVKSYESLQASPRVSIVNFVGTVGQTHTGNEPALVGEPGTEAGDQTTPSEKDPSIDTGAST
jgi:hypothetical protein